MEEYKLVGEEHPVLDRGFVQLIDTMGNDERIADAARVSYSVGTKRLRSDEGLIRYLVKNKHTTPLEQVKFTFRVKAPISVARQWMRHRTGSFNEVSTRYSEVEDDFYLPYVSRMARQDTKNRQGSGEKLDEDTAIKAYELIGNTQMASFNAYVSLLKLGLAREIARGVLPLDTYTKFYWSVDLHNLMQFLTLRLDEHAQWEIRHYAKVCLDLAFPIAPIAFHAWQEYNSKYEYVSP